MQQPPNPYSYNPQQQGQSPPPQYWQQPPQLPPPQQPSSQQPKKKNKKKNWIAIIGVVIAGITLIVALLTWLHPFSPAPPHSGVQDTLTEECNALLHRDYQTDRNLNATEAKQHVNEQEFVTNQATFANSHGGLVSCTVNEATDNGSSGRGITTYVFNDGNVIVKDYILVMEDGSWKILLVCVSPCSN